MNQIHIKQICFIKLKNNKELLNENNGKYNAYRENFRKR